MKLLTFSDPELVKEIKTGKVVVLPTDTIYGIHASVFHPEAVERMYQIRLRDHNKPFIVLLSTISELKQFGVSITQEQLMILEELSLQSVSFALPVTDERFTYLTRGTQSIAFRFPQKTQLRNLLIKAGPLVSTSVNKQGEEPAETIDMAQKTFGDQIDYAVDEGTRTGEPSTLVRFVGNKLQILRQGGTRIPLQYLVE